MNWTRTEGMFGKLYYADSEDGLRVTIHRNLLDPKLWNVYVRRIVTIGDFSTVVGEPNLTEDRQSTLKEAKAIAQQFFAAGPMTNGSVQSEWRKASGIVIDREIKALRVALGWS